ncbi:MAG: hypothetical protein P1V34_05920 [Alphaproteobacteria bacterium]|nr:hypothetical protein [Alphaproteobacteria bacterium]
MTRTRFIPRPTVVSTGVAFDTAQDAWLWAAFVTRHGAGGVSLTANKSHNPRPCEPRDVISLACRLRRTNVLSGYEFGALCRYGAAERPPDPRTSEEVEDANLWSVALGKLTEPLAKKGIVKAQSRSTACDVRPVSGTNQADGNMSSFSVLKGTKSE